MENLPILVIKHIVKYLSKNDVLSCSSTNSMWRDLMNSDVIWEAFCDKALVTHLKETECQVDPVFVSPEQEDSTLSPICEWRLIYMRQVHLWNNWRQGRYIQHHFTLASRDVQTPFIQFINSNQVIIKLADDKTIMLWDVTKTPVHLCDPVMLTLNVEIDLCEVVGEEIIFLQQNLIQIYNFTTASWKLKGIYYLASLNIRSAFITSNMLVALSCDNKLEIFDTKKCETVKMSVMPDHNSSDVFVKDVIQGDGDSKHFAVLLKLNDVNAEVLHMYSIQKLDFINFYLWTTRLEFFCMVHGELVFTYDDGVIEIYNYQSLKLVIEVDTKMFSRHLKIMELIPSRTGLHSLFYKVEEELDGETNSKNLSVLFFVNKSSHFVPIAWNCFGKCYEPLKLLKYLRNHLTFSRQMAVGVPNVYSNSVVNDIYTKLIDRRDPCVITFW